MFPFSVVFATKNTHRNKDGDHHFFSKIEFGYPKISRTSFPSIVCVPIFLHRSEIASTKLPHTHTHTHTPHAHTTLESVWTLIFMLFVHELNVMRCTFTLVFLQVKPVSVSQVTNGFSDCRSVLIHGR